MSNVYFALTEEFNGAGFIALLASGQAVVFYRIALMSKDGDWVLREIDRMQGEDRQRMRRYEAAAGLYPAEFRAKVREDAPLAEAHAVAVDLAERLLPATLDEGGS